VEYGADVAVDLRAIDNPGGSGVHDVRFAQSRD